MALEPEKVIENVAAEAADDAARKTRAAVTAVVAENDAAARSAVASAGTAAALAQASAAEAELTAAEAIRLHTERVAEWQGKTDQRFQEMETKLQTEVGSLKSEISLGMERLSSLLATPLKPQEKGPGVQAPNPEASAEEAAQEEAKIAAVKRGRRMI